MLTVKYAENSMTESAGVMSYVIEGGDHGKEVWKVRHNSLERYWKGSRAGHGNYWARMPVGMKELVASLEKGGLDRGLYDSIEEASTPGLSGS